MDCPRCGAQTTSPHEECYVERELHGRSWTFNPPPAYEPPQYSEPLGPPLTVMTNRAGWRYLGGRKWIGRYRGYELAVFADSTFWKFRVRLKTGDGLWDFKEMGGDFTAFSDVERVKHEAMLFTKTLGEQECDSE